MGLSLGGPSVSLGPKNRILGALGLPGASDFAMRDLWGLGEQGAWYDPSDFERYTAKGPELVTNGDFSNGTAGWTALAVTTAPLSVVNGSLHVQSNGGADQNPRLFLSALQPGKVYEVVFTVVAVSATRSVRFRVNGDASMNGGVDVLSSLGVGTYRCVTPVINASTTAGWMMSSAVNGEYFEIDNVSVRELSAITTASMYQDATGTTPVTAVEQPVGLMLDKRLGVVRGPELVTNGTFDTNTTGWTANLGTISVVNGALRLVGAGDYPSGRQSFAVTPGATYEVTGLVRSVSGAQAVMLVRPQGFDISTGQLTTGATTQTTFQQFRGVVVATTATLYVRATINEAASTGTVEFDNISVREIPGNHASQATTTARPLLSARKNLQTLTEAIGSWTASTITGTTSETNPFGGNNATLLTASAAGASRMQRPVPVPTSTSVTLSCYMKAGSANGGISYSDGGGGSVSYGKFNLVNGTVSGTSAGATASIESVGGGWYRCSVNITTATANGQMAVGPWDGSADAFNYPACANGKSVYVWGAQVEFGPVATRYQRVNTTTDYDWVGFPMYLKFDGVDDFLVTGAVNFTATNKVSVITGVRKLSDSAAGVLVELGATGTGTGTATFGILAPASAGSTYSARSNGTFVPAATAVTTYVAPITNVLTLDADISLDKAVLRVNGVQGTSTTGDQGTGTYQNAALYIGRRGDTTLPFNGYLYNLVIRGAASTSTQLVEAERAVASKTGVTLT